MINSDYKAVALFRTIKVFNITGRGQVLAGQIENGEINAGNWLIFKNESTATIFNIESVEYIDTIGKKETEIRLMITASTDEPHFDIKSILGDTVTIFER